jgi:hypothetical protein
MTTPVSNGRPGLDDEVAPILEHTAQAICFQVDAVERSLVRLPRQQARQQLTPRIGSSLLAFSHEDAFPLVKTAGNHPLVSAVHLAFSQHYPLLLTPDMIWLTIAQGFAQHINNQAEALQPRLVRHAGKRELVVATEALSQPAHWASAIAQWSDSIREQVGDELYQLLLCDFSTTTVTTRTASQVVMLEAFQHYFDYRLYCICGIPQITLQGTPADWRKLRTRMATLAQYELAWWTDRLLPIGDALLATAEGQPPLAFWQSIYKPKASYGGEVITGWLADLFPYIQHPVTRAPTVRNPILNTPRAALTVAQGIAPHHLPAGLSQAPFTLHLDRAELALELIAGFLGVHQQPDSGRVQAEIGWAVRAQPAWTNLLTKLGQVHETCPPVDWSQVRRVPELPKALIELLQQFDGATLFAASEHPWHIRPLRAYRPCAISGVTHFIDLKDGRCVAYKFDEHPNPSSEGVWVVVGKPQPEQGEHTGQASERVQLEQPKVIARGIAELFERIVRAQGAYYFDDPIFQVDDGLGGRVHWRVPAGILALGQRSPWLRSLCFGREHRQ